MFKLFPCGPNKRPLFIGWQEAATSDPVQLKAWQDMYGAQLTHWGLPTGKDNGVYALDVDVKDGNGFDSLQGKEIPATMWQDTPSGGRHYLFKYPSDGKEYKNTVKFLPNLDTRSDGGYIIYYGAVTAPLAEAPAWLLEAAGSKPDYNHTDNIIKVSPDVANSRMAVSLEKIKEAADGDANHTLNREAFQIGQLVKSGAIDETYAKQAITAAAIARGKDPKEIRLTLESAFKGSNEKPLTSPFGAPSTVVGLPAVPIPTRWTPTHFTMTDLFNTSMLKKPQLFQDWSTEDIHITTADGGTGKTTLKLYEAICLALGERFLGFNNVCGPGKTLFITGEDTAGKLGAMIGAIAKQMGIADNPDKLNMILSSIVVKKDSELCIITKDKLGFLHLNEQGMARVMEAVEDIKPKMIVFDPISSFWGSESALNDMAKAVSKFMARLVDASGACVEMVNHMGKASSANKDMSQFAGRGGSGLPSHARVSRVLRPVGDEEYGELTGETLPTGQTSMMCNVNKFSDGSPLFDNPFLIIRDGYLFYRKVIANIKVREKEVSESDLKLVFDYVKECRASNKYASRNVIVAKFMSIDNTISESRIKRALNLAVFEGYLGEKLMEVENPDMSSREKVFTIADSQGKEL